MRPRWLFVLLLFLCLAIAAGSGYVILGLRHERDALTDEVHQAEQRNALLQRGYAKQKALAAGLQHAKVTLEAQKQSLERKAADLEAEMEGVVQERDRLTDHVATLEAAAEQLRGRIAELDADQEKLVAARDDLTQQLTTMTAARQESQANLKRETRRLERCDEHNTKLTAIAKDLMEMYHKKGVMSVLMEKEPLVGLKKIEMDNLIDEYAERVEQEHVDDVRRDAGGAVQQ